MIKFFKQGSDLLALYFTIDSLEKNSKRVDKLEKKSDESDAKFSSVGGQCIHVLQIFEKLNLLVGRFNMVPLLSIQNAEKCI